MTESPTPFNDPTQALNVLWAFTLRLAEIVGWVCIALAHLLLIQLMVAILWAQGIPPATLWTAFLAWLQSATGAALGFAGVSVASMATAWLWLVRRMHHAWFGGALRFLLQDAR